MKISRVVSIADAMSLGIKENDDDQWPSTAVGGHGT